MKEDLKRQKILAGPINESKREEKDLNRLMQKLWQDIQLLEVLYCFQLKGKVNFFDEVRNFEQTLIKRALLLTGGNQRRSARLLGMTPSNLNQKLKRYGISIKQLSKQTGFYNLPKKLNN